MHLHEAIFCATAPASPGTGPGCITLHDIQTGSSFASFKQTSAGAHCTAFVESRNGLGGFVLSAQSDKSILNTYNFQKDQIALKIVLPEKLSCITIDPRGEFCAGGTSQGRIYIWEIASGVLFNFWDAHYRAVSVLRFTSDGAALLSGSEDSGLGVWSVSRLLDDDLQNDPPAPYCTFSDHTLPITDIICSMAGDFPACRVLTASVDHSVKLWDLASRTLLTTFAFPTPISRIAWDTTERMFFAASAGPDGSIHQVNLFRARDDKLSVEAVGGAGVTDVIRVEEEDFSTKRNRLISVGTQITSLALSLTSTLLLVGTATGLVHTYDVSSHQLLRTLSAHKDKAVSVTALAAMLRPPDLVGHVSFDVGTGRAGKEGESWPVRPVTPFQRMKNPKSREGRLVPMILPVQEGASNDLEGSYSMEELIRDQAFFIQPENSSSSNTSLQTRVSTLEAEIASLREQLGRARGVNDVMWETVVQRVVGVGKTKKKDDGGVHPENEEEGEEGRRKKRGRT